MNTGATLVIQFALTAAVAPLVTGFVRLTKARLTRKKGPSPLQPYRDLYRLIRKETVVAENASWIFTGAPTFIAGTTLAAALLVPTFVFDAGLAAFADLLTLVGLLAAARFALALAGLDIGTSFGGIGASREMLIAAVAEPALWALIFSLALVAGSTRLADIAWFVQSPGLGLRISLLLAFVGFVMVAIAENGRIPIDNPATHLELTMVHEAMVLEYSGRHLALIEYAASLKLTLYIALIAAIFVPWGIADRNSGPAAEGFAILFFLAKLLGGACGLGFLEVTTAKLRVFRTPQFLGTALMLGLLAALLQLVSRSL